MQKLQEQVILDGIRVSNGNWFRKITVGPEDLKCWASDADFADLERPLFNDPILDAPEDRTRGGVNYFDSSISRIGFQEMLYSMGIDPALRKFAVFYCESVEPKEECYLSQMRVVTSMALYEYYTAICDSDCESYQNQICGLGDGLWRFICQEEVKFGQKSARAIDWTLGFGLIAERHVVIDVVGKKATSGVYRIWSRPIRKITKKIEG